MKSITFKDALEVVESLPEDQRESLLEIIRSPHPSFYTVSTVFSLIVKIHNIL